MNSSSRMMFISLLAVASLTTLVTSQNSGTVTTISPTSTAASYASGNVTYNTNNSPVSLNTVFIYTTSGQTRTRTETIFTPATLTVSGNSTIFASSASSTSIVISGSVAATSSAINGTATRNPTSTSSAARPTNTVPCNGYPQLCNRKYSNITHVAAHNSPFSVKNNIASNQALDVTTQLNDGIRMLQFQVHKPNDTLYLCHTSCDLLNAGTLVDYLTTVRQWLDQNRYDVITILMGNYPVLDPSDFVGPVVDSGIIDYVYTPPTVPMALSGWPTLGEMILRNQRAVVMLDYEANQAEIPWLLDEFSYMWETPFSPTDRDFPCTVDRPPTQDAAISQQRMSLANHNLNVDIALAGISLLVPASNVLNETNAVDGYGSAGWAVTNCTRDWNRPPTFLMVDYYNIGNFNGSVFAVAAAANNVTYDQSSCCGVVSRSAGVHLDMPYRLVLAIVAAVSVSIVLM